jgi:putative transposase
MVTPAAKREAVAHVRSVFELSERRACRIIGCVRMTSAVFRTQTNRYAINELVSSEVH